VSRDGEAKSPVAAPLIPFILGKPARLPDRRTRRRHQSFGYDDDDFDRWSRDRDRREDRSQSSRYVSSDVIGYEDLDDNGGWRPTAEYGTVWFPHTDYRRLGALSLRPLGVDFALGLDLGR